ncbi:MAG: hemolysin III family protein [Eggerthellaceae bacterium]|nr:hemolysin III family protein [Eggerthellaceae bacterium]
MREYSIGEEIFNATSHGIGALLSIAAIPITVVTAVSHESSIALLAALVFSIAMVLEYTASTLYHALTAERAKRIFKVLDHSAIYLLIAGTYTPYCLLTLQQSHGAILAALVWGLALIGIAIEAFWTYRPRWVSAIIYVILGWLVAFFMPEVVHNLATPGFVLLLAGGICYTIGAAFYVMKKIPYMHSVFHLFVLAGTILQFLSIELYVL